MIDKVKHCVLRLSQAPLVTLVLSLAAVAALGEEQLSAWLVYDRQAIAGGELWRLLSGHLTHWNFDHLLWDVAMFGLLGTLIESRRRAGFAVLVISSAAAISAVLWFCQPRITVYRGLSGIDSALFVHAALMLHRDARRSGSQWIPCTLLLALVGFSGKIAYELLTESTLFVDSAAAGFLPLPLVHAVGGLVGAFSLSRMREARGDVKRGVVRKHAAI